jgi:subtilisin family serine protease
VTPTSTATAPWSRRSRQEGQLPGAPDATGVAPGATLFDVRVLDATGVGSIGDVIAGIDWVIYHSKEYGIRVLNLSLAADSTESFRTDPLCRAARAATAAGITVVVAAGNYGKNAHGGEQFGTITAPGNDPSVITVGSANGHGTALRGDDSINHFSSRGPTLGVWVDSAGNVRHDDMVKPDLVAPGNRVLGALSQAGKTYSTIVSLNPWLRLDSYASTSTNGLMELSGTSIAAPGGLGRSCAHAAGQSRAYPAAHQSDPPVHGATAARCKPGAAGRRSAQCGRRGAARRHATHRHCRRDHRGHHSARQQPAPQWHDAPRAGFIRRR